MRAKWRKPMAIGAFGGAALLLSVAAPPPANADRTEPVPAVAPRGLPEKGTIHRGGPSSPVLYSSDFHPGADPTSPPSADPSIPPNPNDESDSPPESRIWLTANSPAGILAACTPETGVDYPHVSTSPGGWDMSGHGWWNRGTCNNWTAKVRACLYEYYNDGTWKLKACNTRELAPRNPNGGRTTVRKPCEDGTLTSWYNIVDVDVIGESDTGEQRYYINDDYCRVYS